MKQLGVALAVVVVVLAAILLLPWQQHPLNVVLVVFDTCRADHLGCYGCGKAATPVVDGLAASGLLFERAYAQVPLTLPSHATLLTGTYPDHHRIPDNGGGRIPAEHRTLAEALRDNGYTTAAFVLCLEVCIGTL